MDSIMDVAGETGPDAWAESAAVVFSARARGKGTHGQHRWLASLQTVCIFCLTLSQVSSAVNSRFARSQSSSYRPAIRMPWSRMWKPSPLGEMRASPGGWFTCALLCVPQHRRLEAKLAPLSKRAQGVMPAHVRSFDEPVPCGDSAAFVSAPAAGHAACQPPLMFASTRLRQPTKRSATLPGYMEENRDVLAVIPAFSKYVKSRDDLDHAFLPGANVTRPSPLRRSWKPVSRFFRQNRWWIIVRISQCLPPHCS